MSGRKAVEVIARGLVRRGDSILVCRSLAGGYGYLPGGHVEFGEAAGEALRREFLEESGLEVRVGRFLMASEHGFTQQGRPHHEINLVFHVELPAGVTAVDSREPDIAFSWIGTEDAHRDDLRPSRLFAALFPTVSGGLVSDFEGTL